MTPSANSLPDLSARPAAGTLESPYAHYFFKLTKLVMQATHPTGLLMRVKVDGGPPLRLLLDSGAEHLTIDRSAARRSGHSDGTPANLIGVKSVRKAALITEASTVDIEGLMMRNCPLVIAETKLMDGIDGVIPLSMFASFLIHLNFSENTLTLEPFTREDFRSREDFIQAVTQKNLLFLEMRLNEQLGYVLLDTGSGLNVLSKSAALLLQRPQAAKLFLPFANGAGQLDGGVTMDLSEMSRRHNLEVYGILGYPALTKSVLTIDYRRALVRICAAGR